MAYTIKKQQAKIDLDNGTDSQGRAKYVTISVGDMDETTFDPSSSASQTALLAIVGALEPCLSKTVGVVSTVTTATITA